MAWRAKWGADTILEDYKPPEVMQKYWPGSHFGFDKEGHPIIISVNSNVDFKGNFYFLVKVGLSRLPLSPVSRKIDISPFE